MIAPPGTFGTPDADVRLDGEELRAVNAAEQLAEYRDPRRIEISRPVAVDVHADFDLAHEAHQVDHRLPQRVAVGDPASAGAPR